MDADDESRLRRPVWMSEHFFNCTNAQKARKCPQDSIWQFALCQSPRGLKRAVRIPRPIAGRVVRLVPLRSRTLASELFIEGAHCFGAGAGNLGLPAWRRLGTSVGDVLGRHIPRKRRPRTSSLRSLFSGLFLVTKHPPRGRRLVATKQAYTLDLVDRHGNVFAVASVRGDDRGPKWRRPVVGSDRPS